MFYLENNVFEEALERIRMIYDNYEDVVVSMSGGKDSTVLFNMTLIVAKEKNRLPLKVFWLDQEIEWQSTVDYMTKVMHRPDVQPLWYQFPFDFTNSASGKENFVHLWDEQEKDKWVHGKDDLSIKENPTKHNRFHDIIKYINTVDTTKTRAVLVGMRIEENYTRRMALTAGKAKWRGYTWCTKEYGTTRTFYPIYDFTAPDIWTAIAKNKWEYNAVYDKQYQYGMPCAKMRVSALIHETAWTNLEMLQEFEPKTYEKVCKRVTGVSTMNHSFDYGDVIPKDLPFMFKDWKEYRDYLLEHIVKPEYWDLFKRRWAKQEGDEFYKIHVKECIINDIDGTINGNMVAKKKTSVHNNEERKKRDKINFEEWEKSHDN
jgi:predicted phosphoadenosine phosphosulfate sulfurtransferase